MTAPTMLDNILGQPDSLRQVAEYQLGVGFSGMQQAAEILRSANRIVLSGMGSSLYASLPLDYYLNARGIAATSIEASELLHYKSALCGPGTAVVLVSRSGETIEAVKLIDKLEGAGAAVIGVTNEPGTSLHRKTGLTLLVNSLRDQTVAVQTYSGTLATMVLLGAETCGESSGIRIGLQATADALAGVVAECLEVSEGWRSFFEPARAIYVLGRGASVGSVIEGALLFHETAKTPAVGMTGAQFRHGPVEVVESEFRGIVFASQARTAELDGALARDIKELGARAFPIGPYAEGGISWLTDGVPEELAPLLEIVPVQVAAMRLAEWKGIVPGVFRIAPTITVTEAGF
jgi:glucosamine--fructose-6-phosphate aminotransferase (isomerizing)